MSSLSLKVQVLEIAPKELRSYGGRSWYQRTLQCFGEHKVFTHNLTAPSGDSEDAILAQQKLDAYQAGFYMFGLQVEQGDRGRAVFAIREVQPIKQEGAK